MNNKELEMKAQEHGMTDINEEAAEESYKAVESGVVSTYKKIETGVVDGYKKMETGIVEGFNKLTDKCVEVLFAKEGESVEDAKKRLNGKEHSHNG